MVAARDLAAGPCLPLPLVPVLEWIKSSARIISERTLEVGDAALATETDVADDLWSDEPEKAVVPLRSDGLV